MSKSPNWALFPFPNGDELSAEINEACYVFTNWDGPPSTKKKPGGLFEVDFLGKKLGEGSDV